MTTDDNRGRVIINGNISHQSESKKMCFTLGELVKFASICLSLMSSEISLDLSKKCQYQQNEQVFANTKT